MTARWGGGKRDGFDIGGGLRGKQRVRYFKKTRIKQNRLPAHALQKRAHML